MENELEAITEAAIELVKINLMLLNVSMTKS